MIRLIGLAITVALMALPAAAADIYTGTIGTAPVVVLLDPHDVDAGRYYYRSSGADIPLRSAPSEGPILAFTEEIEERARDADDAAVRTSGLWRLRRSGASLVGDWRARPGAAPRPARLTLLARTDNSPRTGPARLIDYYGEAAGAESPQMPYLLERLRGPLQTGPEHALGVGAWRLVTEPRTGVAWPRLLRFPDEAGMRRLNAVFEQNHAIAVGGAHDCAASIIDMGGPSARSGRPRPGGADVRITHLGARLVVLVADGSLSCGGMHPTNIHRSFSYDVRNGALFDAASLLLLETPEQRTAFWRLWRPRAVLQDARHPNGYIADCPTVTATSGDEAPIALRVTDRGLMIMGSDPSSAGAACNADIVELPLADLRPFLRPGAEAYWP
jgi:hypothetical protein